ncbi:MAG: recombination protein NinG [Patescibacteria group bacterium]
MKGGVKPKKRALRQMSALKRDLWELCKQITRKRYQKPNKTWICYTCDRLIDEPHKAQTGHGIPSSVGGAGLRFHLDNLRIQDYYCNINLGGNGSEFYRRLVTEIGQEKVDALFILKNKITKADRYFYEQKIAEYTALLSSLQ